MSAVTNHNAARDNNITFIRATAMILVVLGHSLSPFINNYGEAAGSWCVAYIVRRIIYTFHMPLFMSVSGFLFYYEIERSFQIQVGERLENIISFIDKKIWRLVTPFILVMYLWRKPFLYFAGEGQMPKSIKEMLVFRTTGPLWYLYVLFIIFAFEKLFMWFIWTGKNRITIALVFMFVLAYLGYFTHGTVHHIMVYNFYFFIGIMIHKYFDRIQKIRKRTLWFLLVLTLCLTIFLTCFNTEDVNALTALLNMIVALADIIIIYFLTVGMRDRPIYKLISIAGNHGMGVYLFHSEFITVLVLMTEGMSRKLAWLCTFAGSFILSFFLTSALKKIGVKMILGEFKPKRKYLQPF